MCRETTYFSYFEKVNLEIKLLFFLKKQPLRKNLGDHDKLYIYFFLHCKLLSKQNNFTNITNIYKIAKFKFFHLPPLETEAQGFGKRFCPRSTAFEKKEGRSRRRHTRKLRGWFPIGIGFLRELHVLVK